MEHGVTKKVTVESHGLKTSEAKGGHDDSGADNSPTSSMRLHCGPRDKGSQDVFFKRKIYIHYFHLSC